MSCVASGDGGSDMRDIRELQSKEQDKVHLLLAAKGSCLFSLAAGFKNSVQSTPCPSLTAHCQKPNLAMHALLFVTLGLAGLAMAQDDTETDTGLNFASWSSEAAAYPNVTPCPLTAPNPMASYVVLLLGGFLLRGWLPTWLETQTDISLLWLQRIRRVPGHRLLHGLELPRRGKRNVTHQVHLLEHYPDVEVGVNELLPLTVGFPAPPNLRLCAPESHCTM